MSNGARIEIKFNKWTAEEMELKQLNMHVPWLTGQKLIYCKKVLQEIVKNQTDFWFKVFVVIAAKPEEEAADVHLDLDLFSTE